MKRIVQLALAPFQEKVFDERKRLHFVREDGTGVDINQAEYVFYYYQSYEQGDASDTPMVSMVFKLATGNFLSRMNLSEILLNTDRNTIRWDQQMFEDEPKTYILLADHIYASVSKSNLYVMKIGVGYKKEWHTNLAIFTGNAGQIDVYLYEPNGNPNHHSDKELFEMHASVNAFIEKLSIDTRIKLNIADVDQTCPVGLQFKSKEKYGLCTMFSYLWMYVVFILVHSKVSLKYAIRHAETAIHEAVKENQLVSTVFNFALHLIDKYMTSEPYKPERKIRRAQRILEDELSKNPRRIVPKTARKPRSPPLAHSKALIRYGRECKAHSECETQFCNQGKCDHNPEYETHSIDSDMQSFLESIDRPITTANEEHLFRHWIYLLPRAEQDFVNQAGQYLRYRLRFRRVCKQFEPRHLIEDDERDVSDYLSDDIEFSLNAFVQTYKHKSPIIGSLFWQWIALLTRRQRKYIQEHILYSYVWYRQQFDIKSIEFPRPLELTENGNDCVSDRECASSYCNEKTLICDIHPLLPSLQESMEEFLKTIKNRNQSSRLLFRKWVKSIGEEYDIILEQNLFTYVSMFQHRLEPEYVQARRRSSEEESDVPAKRRMLRENLEK